ncbi:hypothetical protein K3495_g5728 [Podosphaera aphanis]|nr:hypothetical protein K3495_g5728 [Podosphaera aphanis]
MSSSNEVDPFFQVQADVLSQLERTRPLFTSFLRIRTFTSSSSPELLSARSELLSAINSLSEDISDLDASVRAVQSDPYKYGLEVEEVARREILCQNVRKEVEEMQYELDRQFSDAPRKKKTDRNYSESEDAIQSEGNTYDSFEQQHQQLVLAEQDVQLDSVSQTVYNIRQQASDMGRELEEQAEMLERVDGLADRVGGRLQTGLKSMGSVLARNEDGISSCCIAMLIIVLVLLLILVLIL